MVHFSGFQQLLDFLETFQGIKLPEQIFPVSKIPEFLFESKAPFFFFHGRMKLAFMKFKLSREYKNSYRILCGSNSCLTFQTKKKEEKNQGKTIPEICLCSLLISSTLGVGRFCCCCCCCFNFAAAKNLCCCCCLFTGLCWYWG